MGYFYGSLMGVAMFFFPVVRNQNIGLRLLIAGINGSLAKSFYHEHAEAVWKERVYRAWQMTIIDNEMHDKIFV